MTVETIITLAVSCVIVPSVAWLVKEVLALRGKMIELETRMDEQRKNCERHQQWNGALQSSINRMDKNIAKLCMKAGIAEESA